ncbi:MAG TPA: hypothetical protein VM911_08600 [Pyrinomonadaceae bacterium]|jgi:hypothetical protein|nr:hypothetical protein [Pyrinomonadaceae bacterium]
MTVWLITWEAFASTLVENGKIAGIYNYRLGDRRIKEVVQQLYVDEIYSLEGRLAFANGKLKLQPYEIVRYYFYKGRVPYSEIIYCGLDPVLKARKVDNVKVIGEAFSASLEWTERPEPIEKLSAIYDLITKDTETRDSKHQ